MGLFSSNSERKIEQLDSNIKSSFERVKHDNELIFQWINYLAQDNSRLQNQLYHVENELRSMPNTNDQVRSIIDSHYSFEPLLLRIKAIENRNQSGR